MHQSVSRAILASAIMAAPAVVAHAQQSATVTGRVTAAATGQPLANVQVAIATSNVGAQTRDDGTFSFVAPARLVGTTVTVTVRRIGYQSASQTVALRAGANPVNFSLTTAATQLTGVVVSALGVVREKSQLGTAQQQLTTTELNTTHDPNVLNQLSGKVSGVQITGAGTQGGSSTIRVRGFTSINGNNEPLFVIDGVPVLNTNRGGNISGAGGTPGAAGGTSGQDTRDFGSTIQDINPDDIATLTVLKGPNAAALYGSRAANGAIVITTKRGQSGLAKIDVNTNVTYDRPSILPKYQNQYGQGSGGEFDWVDGAGGGVQDYNDQSFGPRLDGRTTGCVLIDANHPELGYDKTKPCRQFTAPQGGAWVAHPDNVNSYFNTGVTQNATAAVSGGTDRSSARLSLTGENVSGIIPNSFLRKISALANGQLQAGDRVTVTGNVNYIRNSGQNRPTVGYNGGILEQFVWFGRQVDMDALRSGYSQNATTNGGPSNREYNWNYSYHNNPFWMMYSNPERDVRDRTFVNGSAALKVTDWLTGTLRSGTDFYRFNIDQQYAGGNIEHNNGVTTVDPNYSGAFYATREANLENNTELLLNTSNAQLTRSIAVNATAGANRRYNNYSVDQVSVAGISVPGIYNVGNAAISPINGQTVQRRQVNSVYGSASFTLNNYFTVEGTARNDWSSTLPKGNNSYFYPSVATSLVVSELAPAIKNYGVSYLKVRASTARVGSDASAYQLLPVFNGNSSKFGSQPLFSFQNAIPNSNLKPERTTSNEGGVEIGFLDNRITLDASIYRKYTADQIINLAISSTAGFNSRVVNAGTIDNHGVEGLISVVPIRRGGFEWTSTFNYSQNRAKVVSLAPGLQTIVLGTNFGGATVEARVGEAYGTIRGYPQLRDSTGQLVLNNGLPQRGALSILGNVQPIWNGGFSNQFRYKQFTLNALVDVRRGGKIFSVTNYYGSGTGVFDYTLKGREVDWNNPGIVVQGVDAKTKQANTATVTSEDYWTSFYLNRIHEPFVYDASYVKLRELRFGVDLPNYLTRRLRASSANLAFVGRNLLAHTNVPNIDPEFSYSSGNYQGFEFASLPNARSIGFSFRITP